MGAVTGGVAGLLAFYGYLALFISGPLSITISCTSVGRVPCADWSFVAIFLAFPVVVLLLGVAVAIRLLRRRYLLGPTMDIALIGLVVVYDVLAFTFSVPMATVYPL
jgi:hypothetical protein